MMTDSQRIIRLSCRRAMPTARRRPSSLVRSKIDRASVLTMPIRAISTARSRRMTTNTSTLSIWPATCFLYAAWSCSSTEGYSARIGATAARAAWSVTPLARLASTRLSRSSPALAPKSSSVMM